MSQPQSLQGNTWKTALRKWRLPLLAFALLCLFIALTPPKVHTDHRTPLQSLAHHLGHEINSIWVGVSIILLVIPSLYQQWFRKQPDPWAWRAFDAALLDFLVVDALGKNLLTGLVRPGGQNQPGFPSGHATMAFIMAWLVWQRFPKLGPVWFAFATLIAWSRIESHAHYPYQVIVGALYGCAGGALIVSRETGVLLPRILLTDQGLLQRLVSSHNASNRREVMTQTPEIAQ